MGNECCAGNNVPLGQYEKVQAEMFIPISNNEYYLNQIPHQEDFFHPALANINQIIKKSLTHLNIQKSLQMQQLKTTLVQMLKKMFDISIEYIFSYLLEKNNSENFNIFGKVVLEEVKKKYSENIQKFQAWGKNKDGFHYYKYFKEIFLEKSILLQKKVEEMFQKIKISLEMSSKDSEAAITKEDIKILLELYVILILKKAEIQKRDEIINKALYIFRNTLEKDSEFGLKNSDEREQENNSVFGYFQGLGLNTFHFNSKGHRKFSNQSMCRVSLKGGLPYFQPIYVQRFGLNVQRKEKQGNNWLSSDGNVGEWAVGFIAVKSAEIFQKNTQRQMDFNFELCEDFKFEQAINKQSQKVGVGVALSPLFTYCLLNQAKTITKYNRRFRMLLQCRFNPKSLKCTKNDKIWIINQKKDFRPYGIIICTEEQLQMFDWLQDTIYEPKWKWNQFKNIKNIELIPRFRYQPSLKIEKIISQNKQTKNLKLLNLACTSQKQKVTSKDITRFIKVALPNVEEINFKGNAIGDQGVQVLCQVKYQKLKQLDLNDNSISVDGVSHLINNTWNKQVSYKLDAVSTKDGGYALKAGENIKTIKTLIQSPKMISNDSIDNLLSKDKKSLYKALHLMMQTPLEGKPELIAKQSEQLYKTLSESVKKKNDSVQQVLLSLKAILDQAEVTFSKQSHVKSQLSMKILTSRMQDQTVMIKHRVTDKQWNFKQFRNNSDLMKKFEDWYTQKIAKEYCAELSDITIHKITEGSVQVQISLNIDNNLLKNEHFPSNQKICLIPFFRAFNFSQADFEESKDFLFPEQEKCKTQWRGGIPYFQPVHCKRFGLKVQKLYDGGDNSWLLMDGNAKEWGVGFHGIKYPGNTVPSSKQTVLEAIMSGRQKGQMLIPGVAQAYKSQIATNKNEQVGDGIYVSPYFTASLLNYADPVTRAQQKYRVILQCRIRPEVLKCTRRAQYWVINQPKNVRPYGILLVTEDQYIKLKQIMKGMYTQGCDWNSWKQQYQDFRKKHNLPF